jgi:hypothetical protein
MSTYNQQQLIHCVTMHGLIELFTKSFQLPHSILKHSKKDVFLCNYLRHHKIEQCL